MIPISDDVRSRTFPYVNVAIIVINLVVFLYEVYLSGQPTGRTTSELDTFIRHWGNIPGCTFDALGRDIAFSARAAAECNRQPETLATLFTSMFMHGGWLHVAFNMLFLWVFGDNIEDATGHVRYLVFYLLGGVVATLTHGLVVAGDWDTSTTPLIGASGAIAAVMGAYLVLHPRARVTAIAGPFLLFIPLPAFAVIGIWFVLQLFSGFSSLGVDAATGGGVAYFAHIGGFVAGAALIWLFTLGRARERRGRERRRSW